MRSSLGSIFRLNKIGNYVQNDIPFAVFESLPDTFFGPMDRHVSGVGSRNKYNNILEVIRMHVVVVVD